VTILPLRAAGPAVTSFRNPCRRRRDHRGFGRHHRGVGASRERARSGLPAALRCQTQGDQRLGGRPRGRQAGRRSHRASGHLPRRARWNHLLEQPDRQLPRPGAARTCPEGVEEHRLTEGPAYKRCQITCRRVLQGPPPLGKKSPGWSADLNEADRQVADIVLSGRLKW